MSIAITMQEGNASTGLYEGEAEGDALLARVALLVKSGAISVGVN